MGWTIASSMPRIYVHLAGHDLDAALLKLPQLPAKQRKSSEPITKQLKSTGKVATIGR
jgi:hypothetical protein